MLPLSGLKVIELSLNFAGPFAGSILGHMGAEVFKVERPEGDDARGWGPPFIEGDGAAFHAVNLNKQSITLDLKDPDQKQWLIDFAADADVMLHNMRPGSVEALGVGPQDMTALYPWLIYCGISAYGNKGPWAGLPGYEPIVQAFAGLMMLSGMDGDPPTRLGTQVLDNGTGMWAAIGILAALARRGVTDKGGVVDVSLLETAMGWLTVQRASVAVTGNDPVRHRTGSSRVVPFEAFPTADGPLMIGAANDRLFPKLAIALQHPEWADDERFKTNAGRASNRDDLFALISSVTKTMVRAELLKILQKGGIPSSPVHGVREAMEHPQVQATGMLQTPPGLDHALMGLPISFDGERPVIRAASPKLGSANEALGVPGSTSNPTATSDKAAQ